MARKGFRDARQTRVDGRLEREIELLVRIKGEVNPKARQRLIGELMIAGEWDAQIRAVTRRWRQAGIVPEEMYSTGVQGWLEAVERFDVSKADGWVGYAHMWIYKRCEELCRRQGAIVAESEWERRQARKAGTSRRAHGWASLDRAAAVVEEPEIVDWRLGKMRSVMAADPVLAARVARREAEALTELRARIERPAELAHLPGFAAAIDRRCAELDRAAEVARQRARLLADVMAVEPRRVA